MNPRLSFWLTLLIVCGGLGAGQALACSCTAPPSLASALAESDAVLLGEVISIDKHEQTLVATLTVEKTWKGPNDETVELHTAASGAACGFGFEVGRRYIVYARQHEGALGVSFCSRTRQVRASDDVANRLDEAASYPGDGAEDGLEIAGHAMFRYTQKLDAANSAELYNLRVYLKKQLDAFTFFAEPRFRQTPLRSFSPSNVWLQQAWIGYDLPEQIASVSAGLRYTRLGLFWDHSWFGNLPYLNGLKLDPDYGVEVSGTSGGALAKQVEAGVSYAAQYFAVQDGLNGFFAPDFKLEALAARPEDGFALDFDSAPGFAERNIVVGRVVPELRLGGVEVAAGASFLTSELTGVVVPGVFETAPEGRKSVVALQGTVSVFGASVYAERLDERVSGFNEQRRRTYWLGGLAYTFEREATWLEELQLRLNASYVDYETADATEWFVAPGVHLRLHEMVGFSGEYVRWEFEDRRVVDRIEWIVHAYF